MLNSTTSHRLLILALTTLFVACAPDTAAQDIRIVHAFGNLSFTNPVDLQHAGDGTNRMYVVEQPGVINLIDELGGSFTKSTFLDIRSRVRSGGEMGLLGLAFDPNYESNGFFYVNYTTAGPLRTIIARYTAAANRRIADPTSEKILLSFNQPFENHNGGQIAFGPDGNLYIATGDGGSGGDPQNHGQRLNTLLGKILRIDVRDTTAERPYVIPSDNPFIGTPSAMPEIYAYGLRNPWRFSFDAETGRLWTGDVGQSAWEEIDIIEKGKNYGWKTMEGKHCYPPGSNCDMTGLVLPVWEYGRSLGVSVTGGYVYRGTRLTPLIGEYIYADFATGTIWGLRVSESGEATNRTVVESGRTISSFGVDANNELYFTSFDGRIYRLDMESAAEDEAVQDEGISGVTSEPNPFNTSTRIRYVLDRPGTVKLLVRDMLGSVVATLVDGAQAAGAHSVVLDASGLAAGTYIYTITSGGRATVAGRVVLTK